MCNPSQYIKDGKNDGEGGGKRGQKAAYIFLLFMDMANLEPDIFFSQRPRGISDDVFEALKK